MTRDLELNILYLNNNEPDYLAESLFHGLRKILGANCVDVPRYDSMYAPLTDSIRNKLRGNGFTIYGLLDEMEELPGKRFFWKKDLDSYDYIVIANIRAMWTLAQELIATVPTQKLIFLDGGDDPFIFPFENTRANIKNQPTAFLQKKKNIRYFKRELYKEKFNTPNAIVSALFRNPYKFETIGFSIPKEKINVVTPEHKTKMFASHIVDEDVAMRIQGSFQNHIGASNYKFRTEVEYFQDLQGAKYGITTKRAGWDCLRHYELAANGCVICFKNLDAKPELCAPHGLNSSNSVSYSSFEDLKGKIDSINASAYNSFLRNTYEWILRNTTEQSALTFISKCCTI